MKIILFSTSYSNYYFFCRNIQYVLYTNRKDSASESDGELARIERDRLTLVRWVQSYDYHRKLNIWTNPVDGTISYEEPDIPFGHETHLIGHKVRIYWPVQKEWSIGQVTKFNMNKERHRIDYEDGDWEWMDLNREVSSHIILFTYSLNIRANMNDT